MANAMTSIFGQKEDQVPGRSMVAQSAARDKMKSSGDGSARESGKTRSKSKGTSLQNITMEDIEGFLAKGEKKGEELTGATSAELGEGRADIRSRLKEILGGNSAGAAALKQDNQQAQKSLKASQALSGGGQMNEGQLQAQSRKADIDQARLKSDEERRALADLSKELRGGVQDNMKMSMGWGQLLTAGQQPASAGGSGGSVICTELNRQGLLDSDVYAKDAEYGVTLRLEDPYAYIGYYVWAVHVAKYMAKSKLLTTFIKYPACAWADNMAGKRNVAGWIIEKVGLIVCRTIGKVYISTLQEDVI